MNKSKQGFRVLVQLGTFRAIDVFQRGYYGISCRVYKKYRLSGSNSKRIDGTITIDENINQEFNEPFLGEGREYTRCSISHLICNWRCRPKSASNLFNSKKRQIYTKYLSSVFRIESQGEQIVLNSNVLFDINIPIELKNSLVTQEDCLYIEFELFFSDGDEADPELYQTSSQRRVLQLNLNQLRDNIAVTAYHQLLFDEIYFSSTDVMITGFYSGLLLQQKESSFSRSSSLISLSSMSKSKSWSWNSLINLNHEQALTEDSDIMCNQILDLFVINLECFIKLLQSLYHFIDTNEFQSLWREAFISCPILLKEVDQSHLPSYPDLEQLLLIIQTEKGKLLDKNITLDSCQAFNSLLLMTSMKWIRKFYKESFAEIPAYRYAFRLSKLTINTLSTLEQSFFHFNLKEFKPVVISSQPDRSCPMIEDWPKRSENLYLLRIQNAVNETTRIAEKEAGLAVNLHQTVIEQEQRVMVSKPSLSWVKKTVKSKVHLFIFVHGFLGNTYDLRRYRNQLLYHLSDLGLEDNQHSYLISSFNENDTLSHLSTLGNNLAKEIFEHICKLELLEQIEKISFVCHSMGALIVRMSLRNDLLSPLKHLFYCFTSFASPHCSLLIHTHSLLDPCIAYLS
jgi:hypothetical protein